MDKPTLIRHEVRAGRPRSLGGPQGTSGRVQYLGPWFNPHPLVATPPGPSAQRPHAPPDGIAPIRGIFRKTTSLLGRSWNRDREGCIRGLVTRPPRRLVCRRSRGDSVRFRERSSHAPPRSHRSGRPWPGPGHSGRRLGRSARFGQQQSQSAQSPPGAVRQAEALRRMPAGEAASPRDQHSPAPIAAWASGVRRSGDRRRRLHDLPSRAGRGRLEFGFVFGLCRRWRRFRAGLCGRRRPGPECRPVADRRRAGSTHPGSGPFGRNGSLGDAGQRGPAPDPIKPAGSNRPQILSHLFGLSAIGSDYREARQRRQGAGARFDPLSTSRRLSGSPTCPRRRSTASKSQPQLVRPRDRDLDRGKSAEAKIRRRILRSTGRFPRSARTEDGSSIHRPLPVFSPPNPPRTPPRLFGGIEPRTSAPTPPGPAHRRPTIGRCRRAPSGFTPE